MFGGFSQATGDFIWSLSLNNDRTWFLAHKEEFEAVFNQPFRALAKETCALMQAKHPERTFAYYVSRIYRDARRLFGRGPYKDHLWFTIYDGNRHDAGPVLWFELSGTGYSYGTGIWEEEADVAQAYRRRIEADPAGFERMINAIAARGDYLLWGDMYKRPKGDLGPVINPWYNRKHLSVGYEFGFGGDLFRPDLPELLADGFEVLMPFYDFYREAHEEALGRRAAMRALSLGAEEA